MRDSYFLIFSFPLVYRKCDGVFSYGETMPLCWYVHYVFKLFYITIFFRKLNVCPIESFVLWVVYGQTAAWLVSVSSLCSESVQTSESKSLLCIKFLKRSILQKTNQAVSQHKALQKLYQLTAGLTVLQWSVSHSFYSSWNPLTWGVWYFITITKINLHQTLTVNVISELQHF